MVWMRSPLFWNVTRHWLVSYGCFGTTSWSCLQGSSCLAIEDGTNRLSQNVGSYPLIIAVKHSRRAKISDWLMVQDNLSFPSLKSRVAWPLKIVSISCPEMSAANYIPLLQSISEEQWYQICASFRMLHFSCIKTTTTYFHPLVLVTFVSSAWRIKPTTSIDLMPILRIFGALHLHPHGAVTELQACNPDEF